MCKKETAKPQSHCSAQMTLEDIKICGVGEICKSRSNNFCHRSIVALLAQRHPQECSWHLARQMHTDVERKGGSWFPIFEVSRRSSKMPSTKHFISKQRIWMSVCAWEREREYFPTVPNELARERHEWYFEFQPMAIIICLGMIKDCAAVSSSTAAVVLELFAKI